MGSQEFFQLSGETVRLQPDGFAAIACIAKKCRRIF